jgi:hypothetical protein
MAGTRLLRSSGGVVFHVVHEKAQALVVRGLACVRIQDDGGAFGLTQAEGPPKVRQVIAVQDGLEEDSHLLEIVTEAHVSPVVTTLHERKRAGSAHTAKKTTGDRRIACQRSPLLCRRRVLIFHAHLQHCNNPVTPLCARGDTRDAQRVEVSVFAHHSELFLH